MATELLPHVINRFNILLRVFGLPSVFRRRRDCAAPLS